MDQNEKRSEGRKIMEQLINFLPDDDPHKHTGLEIIEITDRINENEKKIARQRDEMVEIFTVFGSRITDPGIMEQKFDRFEEVVREMREPMVANTVLRAKVDAHKARLEASLQARFAGIGGVGKASG